MMKRVLMAVVAVCAAVGAFAATPVVFTVSGTDHPYWTGDGIVGDRHGVQVTVKPTAAGAISGSEGTVLAVPGDYATIALALEAADPGDTILLAPGTYDATGCAAEGFMITLEEGVTLKGAGATPADTVITGNEMRQVLNITSADATVENLTLRDGLGVGSKTGAGYILQMSGGLVSKCVIAGGLPNTTATFETAVYATGGRITDCEITGMLSGTKQRAPVYLKNATMDHCDVHGNTSAHKYLGLVTVEGADGLVEFCKIHDNSLAGFDYAYRDGSVAAMDGATVRDSEICNNTMAFSKSSYYTAAGVSTIAGRGISAKSDTYGGAVIERCIITNNVYRLATDVANSRNIYMTAGVMLGYKSVLRNCLVANNANTTTKSSRYTWPVSGGVVMSSTYGTGASVENCTIVGNSVSALAQDPKLANGWFGGGTVTNTIVSGDFLLEDAATTVFAYSRTDTLMPGEGNVTGDCAFKDAAAADYHLTIDSAAVRDKAIPLDAVKVDLDGVERPFGPAPDIGCYEYFSEATHSCSFKLDSDIVVAREPFPLTATADPADGVYAYVWTFEKGGVKTVATNFTDRVHRQVLSAAGAYSVMLTVLWGDESGIVATADAPAPQALTAYPRRTYVAADGAGVWPYDTPENAAGSFAEAYAAVYKCAEDPGFVEFAAGTYSKANALDAEGDWLLSVDDGVIVEGASGNRGDTVIDATGARAVKIDSVGAQFRNFTIFAPSNQMSTTACGYGIDLRNGRVENVLVTNIIAFADTATPQVYEHAVYVSGGLLRNVELVDKAKNYSTQYGCGCGSVLFAEGGTIDGCRVHDTIVHERVYGAPVVLGGDAVLTNSLVYGNTQAYQEDKNYKGKAGGIYAFDFATVVDCVVTNNYSTHCARFPRRAGGVVACGSARIIRCVIADNTVDYKKDSETGTVAAGLLLYDSSSAVNCLVTGNAAGIAKDSSVTDAGGVYLALGAAMVNCTVVDNINESDEATAGVQAFGSMINTIVWRNAVGGTPTSVTYCCTPDLFDGAGNIDCDPRIKKGYLIKSSSPCVNAGDPTGWTEHDIDLKGDLRLRQGAIDMGCYQAKLQGLMLMVK